MVSVERRRRPAERLVTGHSRPATKEELQRFFDHFEEALDQSGFLRTAEKRPGMVRNLRNLFQRAECTEQELRTLHGVITAFLGAREKRGRVALTLSAIGRYSRRPFPRKWAECPVPLTGATYRVKNNI